MCARNLFIFSAMIDRVRQPGRDRKRHQRDLLAVCFSLLQYLDSSVDHGDALPGENLNLFFKKPCCLKNSRVTGL